MLTQVFRNNGARYGGNGGLSIRRVSKVKEVLSFQKREDNSWGEDEWLSGRLNTVPGAKMCPPEKAKEFAVADIWHEWPLGFHVNPGGLAEGVWKPVDRRYQIYSYCPEVKIILDMALDREKCQEQLDSEWQESHDWQEQEAVKKQEEDKKAEEEKAELEKQQKDKEQATKDAIAAKKKEKQAALEAARSKKAAVASSLKAAASHKAQAEKYAMTDVLAVAAPPPVRLPDSPLPEDDDGTDESGASWGQQDDDSGTSGRDDEPDDFTRVKDSSDSHGNSEAVAADEDSGSKVQDDERYRNPLAQGGYKDSEESDEQEDDGDRSPLVLGGYGNIGEPDDQDTKGDSEPAEMDEDPDAE